MASTATESRSGGSGTSQREDEHADFDWLTNMALLHINHVFSKFLWRDYPHSKEVTFSWDNIHEGIDKVLENYPEFTVLYHGDYGSMCIPPKVMVQRSPEVTSQVVQRGKNEIWLMDSSGSLVADFQQLVVKPDVTNPGYVQLQVVQEGSSAKTITYGHLKEIYAKLENISTDINKSLAKERLESMCTLCVPIESWPEEEGKWLERAKAHDWPESDLIGGIMLAGCHLTPKTPPGQKFGTADGDPVLWRYCFPSAEMILQPMMNDTMRRILALFCLLLDDDLLLSSVLTKEHVRMELYNTVQKLGEKMFEEDNLGWCFLALTDTIFHDLIMSKIPNYFFPDCNMIQGTEEDFLAEARKKISRIRRDPSHYLFQFEANKRLTCMPEEPIKTLTTPIFQNECGIELKKVKQAINESLYAEIKYRLQSNEYNIAKQCAEDASKMSGIHPCTLLAGMAYHIEDTRLTVSIMEKAYEETTDPGEKAGQMGNLGCMYYGLACQTQDQQEKASLLEKSEAMFRPRLADMDCGVSTKLDYYNIIVSQGRYSEAIPLLRRLIVEHRGDDHGNNFDAHEKGSLDENLQIYIDAGQSVTVQSLNYAYFLLAKCYIQVGGLEMEENFWDDYSAACTRAAQTEEQRVTFSLMGLSLQSIGETERAQIAFMQAIDINEKDIVAIMYTSDVQEPNKTDTKEDPKEELIKDQAEQGQNETKELNKKTEIAEDEVRQEQTEEQAEDIETKKEH